MNEQQEQFLSLTAQIDALNSRLESLEARAIVSVTPPKDGSIRVWNSNMSDGVKIPVIQENSNQ